MNPAVQSINRTSYRYYFDLIWHLVQREFAVRYKGSVLGALWVIVVPLMQLVTLVFVFRKVLPLQIDAYPAFVFTALLPWTWFSNCMNNAGGLFTGNRDLVRRPNFPPILLIMVNTASNLILYLTVLPLVFAVLFAYGKYPGWTFLFFPLLVLIQAILIHGLSLIIASWNVFYRDIQQAVGIVVSLMFWITPIFYIARTEDQRYQFLFDLNPMAGLVKGYRDILFYSRPPALRDFFFSLAVSLLIGLTGYVVYRHKINEVYDIL